MVRREVFRKRFGRRYSLRFHMSLILVVTALSGALTSKLLLMCDVGNLAVRYPLAVAFSYLIFFVCIKLWLLYVSPSGAVRKGAAQEDWLAVPDGSAGVAHGTVSVPEGSGEFSGGGASGDYEVDSHAVAEVGGPSVAGNAGGSSSGGAGIGDAADGFDGEGFVILLVLGALVAVVAGAAIYVVVQAPAILSEAAFEGLLAASLVKKARMIDDRNWVGSVFKATWGPFVLALFVAAFGGLLLHNYFPEAHRLKEILIRH